MITLSAIKFLKNSTKTKRLYTCSTTNFIDLLQLSIESQSLKHVQQLHAKIIQFGLDQNSVIAAKLISTYFASQNTIYSKLVFDTVEHKSEYLWNILINGYAKNKLFGQSIKLFNQMCKSEVTPDEFTFSGIVKILSELGDVVSGKIVHGRCMRNGVVLDSVVANSFMAMYGKCGVFQDSLKVFDEMPYRNISSFNVVISGYMGEKEKILDEKLWDFVKDMIVEGWKFDAFTVSTLLCLCGEVKGNWQYGKELHCYIVKSGLESDFVVCSDVHLGCCLIDMYSKSLRVELGRRVFDRLKHRNVFAWTAMINGYVLNGDVDEALLLFKAMQVEGVEPNKVSLVSILPACCSFDRLKGGKQIHAFSTRRGLNHEVSLCNALIDMYSKSGSLSCARRVFEHDCVTKDAISWSSMISAYSLHGNGQGAIILYEKMLQHGIKPDRITVVGVLSACARSGLVDEGIRIYDFAVNNYDLEPTLEMCACIVDMLGKAGQFDRALGFIKTMPVEPGPSIWGALVNASAIHGNSEVHNLAYRFLIQMEPENPSNYVSLSNLYASSQKWDVVAQVRTMMKDKGLKKFPGCSWISVNTETHSFYVADKSHPSSVVIYEMLDQLILAMKRDDYSVGFEDTVKVYE
ncbi:pentatricopeptide repeat-containing protein At1g06140, mitochondrial-like [Lycium barbarum]|uniref:pentatricopeptide repeat-containing protein At1g06140, mitochondrial-like n=1 Tax=Lycium barbarum TaxID=112863 RepID=UPI00293EE3FB|nr:pentatricopeptide repeat-containing protein At1g06140, mitochondrial-like [Lycium barbarum]